jgi:hypothetical protein
MWPGVSPLHPAAAASAATDVPTIASPRTVTFIGQSPRIDKPLTVG